MKINCRLDLEYPPVIVEGKNIRNAEILFPLYCGQSGELTTLITYVYQSIVSEQTDKRLSDILGSLAVIEMRHFHTLGKLIELLGADPKLIIRDRRGKGRFWGADLVSFEALPRRFLEKNIKEEENAIREYSHAISSISDNYVKSILERIIADEEHHIEIFNELLK